MTSPRTSLGTSGAAAALAAVALLASGCGTSGSDDAGATATTPTARAAPWTSDEASTELTRALRGFSADLDELNRQRNEQHTVAVYAVQCDQLVPQLRDFLSFLHRGRWPASVQPAVDDLTKAQATYNKGLRTCADALDQERLLAGFRQMDTAPIDSLVTRLRTALSAGAA